MMSGIIQCVATCRPGLEGVLEAEIRQHGGADIRRGKRAVYFSATQPVLYRLNMAARSALNFLVPVRTFNARDYDLLYYQARKINWHQFFTVDKTLRIDVNGRSEFLPNTQYVVHRVKDGIVDTFRKLSGGVRPSINKAEPQVHIMVHLDGLKVTICLDSSGVPLFKRGYRVEHGGAPVKEDLAAGILLLSGAAEAAGIVDPVCGTGTFLFEGWMILNNVAPNTGREFSFEHWLDYDAAAHAEQRAALGAGRLNRPDLPVIGCEIDRETHAIARRIKERHFPDAAIELRNEPFQQLQRLVPGGLMVANPPYGERMGEEAEMPVLYRELGMLARRTVPGGQLAVFTTNRKAARAIPLTQSRALTLFNGSLEGLLYQYQVRQQEPA